jgi:hypothetical protein
MVNQVGKLVNDTIHFLHYKSKSLLKKLRKKRYVYLMSTLDTCVPITFFLIYMSVFVHLKTCDQ